MMVPNHANTFIVVDTSTGETFEYDGPFPLTLDGGQTELTFEVGGDASKSIVRRAATNIVDSEGEVGIAMADSEIATSGTIKAADIIDGELLVAIDDPEYLKPQEVADDVLEEVGYD